MSVFFFNTILFQNISLSLSFTKFPEDYSVIWGQDMKVPPPHKLLADYNT